MEGNALGTQGDVVSGSWKSRPNKRSNPGREGERRQWINAAGESRSPRNITCKNKNPNRANIKTVEIMEFIFLLAKSLILWKSMKFHKKRMSKQLRFWYYAAWIIEFDVWCLTFRVNISSFRLRRVLSQREASNQEKALFSTTIWRHPEVLVNVLIFFFKDNLWVHFYWTVKICRSQLYGLMQRKGLTLVIFALSS